MGHQICATTADLNNGSSAWSSGDGRVLRGALAAAIAIHLAVLFAFALLPSWRANGVDIEKINVFESAAASFAHPVEMVSLQELEQPPQIETAAIFLPAPLTQPHSISNRAARTVPPAIASTRHSAMRPGRPGQPSAKREPSRTAPPPAGSGGPIQSFTPGGGGGGPRLPLLPASPSNPGPSIGPGGNTPLGEIPGSGTGSGLGTGTGTGTGSGSGTGSGIGAGSGSSGEGSGTGIGSGSAAGTGEGGEGGGGFSSRLAERAEPKVTYKGVLSYPREAAEEGVEGAVILKVLVDEKGQVADSQITSSSGDKRLDAAALEWVKRWRYLPAVQDGRPRRVWTRAKVTFHLE